MGDTHGNVGWLQKYIYPVAVSIKAVKVVVVGDFGAWEHTPAGVTFMNDCSRLATAAGIPLYWLHGNHDKWSHTVAHYADYRDHKGFLTCRENVYYIPQGLSWTWKGRTFRSFGGAYSIDKSWRLREEKERQAQAVRTARRLAATNLFAADRVPDHSGTLWFPEEEMTDTEMEDLLLLDSGVKDIILSHDKPLSAKPEWDRKDYPNCIPNQLRLERALRVHRPTWWVHGHLHYHYVSPLRGADWTTTVVGLDPDNDAAERGWSRVNSWLALDLGGDPIRARLGRSFDLEQDQLSAARARLAAVL